MVHLLKMGGSFHGYVSHNQMVRVFVWFFLGFGMVTWNPGRSSKPRDSAPSHGYPQHRVLMDGLPRSSAFLALPEVTRRIPIQVL